MPASPSLEVVHAAATAAMTGLIWFVQLVLFPLFVTTAASSLLGVVWASTAFVQVPVHERVSRSFDVGVVRKLVATNWIRTIAWTVRTLLAFRLVGV